jgi:Tfp pilus assembly protein PilV
MDKSTSNITTTMRTDKERGQLLIEALVAISVMMVGMMAVFGVLSQSLSLSRVAADQYIAANLAAEGIEIVKNMVDSEYLDDPTTSSPRAFGTSIFDADNNRPCAVDIYTQPAYLDDGVSWNCESSSDDIRALKFDASNGRYGINRGDQLTKFRRYVSISEGDPTIKVISTVEWSTKSGSPSTVTIGDVLYNWRRP